MGQNQTLGLKTRRPLCLRKRTSFGVMSVKCGGLNRSTQHLLILLEEEVCDGGDCTNMVHAAAEG
jgi:hypothetical protein